MGLTFEIPGEPRGKGRPRFRDGHAYTDNETRAYEKKVVAYYHQALGAFMWPVQTYISIEVTAYYPIPKSAPKAAAAAMQAGTMLPTRKPDIDNVLKVILDSLNGVAYIDDSKVVEVIGRKRYATVPKVVVEMRGSD